MRCLILDSLNLLPFWLSCGAVLVLCGYAPSQANARATDSIAFMLSKITNPSYLWQRVWWEDASCVNMDSWCVQANPRGAPDVSCAWMSSPNRMACLPLQLPLLHLENMQQKSHDEQTAVNQMVLRLAVLVKLQSEQWLQQCRTMCLLVYHFATLKLLKKAPVGGLSIVAGITAFLAPSPGGREPR